VSDAVNTVGKDEVERRFAQNIAAVRRALRMSQQELADRVGMNRSALSELERGHRSARLGEAAAIAEVLGVDLPALLDDKPIIVVSKQTIRVGPEKPLTGDEAGT
jgi:transcriptional regulator with XRE-family HTH domain